GTGTRAPARAARDGRRSVRAGPADRSRSPAAAGAGPVRTGRGSRRRSRRRPRAGPRRKQRCRSSGGDLTRLGALRDRQAHAVAPLGPGAVVVADVLEAQQVGEHEPAVRRALADAAVDDRRRGGVEAELGLVDRLELGARAEAAVLGGGAGPGHGAGGGDVPAAHGALLRVVRHVGALAGVLLRGAHVDQRAAEEVQHVLAVGADRRILALHHRVAGGGGRLALLGGGQLAALRLPGGAAAVEQAHVRVA